MTQPNIFERTDLSGVARPTVTNDLDFETIFRRRLEHFRSLDPNYSLILESDPVSVVMESSAYMQLVQNMAINYAMQQGMLAFAEGDMLDRIFGDSLGVPRALVDPGKPDGYPVIPPIYEDDTRYRFRLQLRAGASSAAGGVDHYKFHAFAADGRVRDAAVYSPNHYPYYNTGGQVVISILSSVGNLVPTEDLLLAVRNRVNQLDIKVLTDIIVVDAAVPRVVNIVADVYLLPRTPLSVFSSLEQKLRDEVAANQALGWDLTKSWLIKTLHTSGVHSVELTTPSGSFRVAPNEFPTIGTVTLVFKGFSDTEAENISAMERNRLVRLMYDTYVEYTVANKRTAVQIADDLVFKDVVGVIQPTTLGLIKHLNLEQYYDLSTILPNLTEEQMAKIIWFYLASENGYLPPGTSNVLKL